MRQARTSIVAVTPVIPVLAVLIASCASEPDGPPVVTVDRTPCAGCGMLVGDLRYVAAYRDSGGGVRVFDDLHCLLEELSGSAGAAEQIWLRDAAGDGWLSPDAATIVQSTAIRTPMGGGMMAFSSRDAAQRHSESLGKAQLVTFAEVRRSWQRTESRRGDG